jgi:serine phosphatase RsbU (regulator of sigma subunit)
MKKRALILVCLLLTVFCINAQTPLDSLQRQLPKLSGKERFDALCSLVTSLTPRDSAIAGQYEREMMTIAETATDVEWKISAWKARAHFHENNYSENIAREDYLQVVRIAHEANLPKHEAAAYINAGRMTFNYTRDLKEALSFYNKAIEIHKRLGNKEGEARAYANIATVLASQHRYSEALDYYTKSLENLTDSEAVSAIYNNIAAMYASQKKLDISVDWMKKSLVIREALKDSSRIADGCGNLGSIYTELGDTANARIYLMRAYNMNLTLADEQSLAYNQLNLGQLYVRKKEFEKAESYLMLAKKVAEQRNSSTFIVGIYETLAELYEAKGDFKQAFLYQKQAAQLSAELLNADLSQQTGEMQARFDAQRREKENSDLRAESERKNIFIWSLCGGALLLALLVFLVFNRYLVKKRSNVALENKNVLITQQKSEIETKSKEITDSIAYARRLQEAVVSDEENLHAVFPESFVLFRPKDVVSGDFFWTAERQTSNGMLSFIAVADCTGHGVPGALLSMIGTNLLHQTIFEKNSTDPGLILAELNSAIHRILHTRGDDRDSDDGMDIGLCVINRQTGMLHFSGANRPLLIRTSDQEVKEFAPDRTAIGGSTPVAFTYATKEQKLEKGDVLYLFTDGYADQFGGPEGKKLLTKNLRKLLVDHASKPMHEQREIYMKRFDEWRGNFEQVDDVLLAGWKV